MRNRIDEIVTPHRRQHDEVVAETTREGNRTTTAYRVATQTPLDRYLHRRQIDQRQWLAGNELYTDWYEANYHPRVTADLTRPRVDESRQARLAANRAMRRRRVEAARQAAGIAWPEIHRVCCEHRPAGSKAAMEILRRGLSALADFYGY